MVKHSSGPCQIPRRTSLFATLQLSNGRVMILPDKITVKYYPFTCAVAEKLHSCMQFNKTAMGHAACLSFPATMQQSGFSQFIARSAGNSGRSCNSCTVILLVPLYNCSECGQSHKGTVCGAVPTEYVEVPPVVGKDKFLFTCIKRNLRILLPLRTSLELETRLHELKRKCKEVHSLMGIPVGIPQYYIIYMNYSREQRDYISFSLSLPHHCLRFWVAEYAWSKSDKKFYNAFENVLECWQAQCMYTIISINVIFNAPL